MFRVNRGYQSLFEYLVKENFRFTHWIDRVIYQGEASRKRWNPHPHDFQQFTGAFQPLADMLKDLVTTFRPYKFEDDRFREFTQVFRGIGMLARGAANWVAAPLLFIGYIFRDIFYSNSWKNFKENTIQNTLRTFTWLIDGTNSFIRGATQVATAPISMSARLIFRCIITPFFDYPPIEKNPGIKYLVKEGRDAIKENRTDDIKAIRDELHRKYLKAMDRSQATEIINTEETKLYTQGSPETMHLYLNLFTPKPKPIPVIVDTKKAALNSRVVN